MDRRVRTSVLSTDLVGLTFLAISISWLTGCGSTTTPTTTTNTPNAPSAPSAPTPPTPPAPPPPSPVIQLAVWTNNFDGIPFTMVGTDPSQPKAGTTDIPVTIIPINFNFNGLVLSPEAPSCADTVSPITRVVDSPIFLNNKWSAGAVSIGNTQFADAFQRANFWSIVSSGSPDYHVLLAPISVSAPLTIDVPLNIGATLSTNPACPSQPYGGIPIDFVTSSVEEAIMALHITADTLPIFVTYNSMFLLPTGGVFLGYHNHIGSQTYIVASYMDNAFSGISGYAGAIDVTILSHEIGEWMDNPLGVNKVPAWGGYGIQQTCNTDLEVGDPLTGSVSTFVDPASGFTYHIQELAFFSWFARNSPSLAVNGLYSSLGKFLSYAPPCT